MEAAGRSTRSGARATSVDCRTSLAPSSKLFAAEPRVALPRLSATGASKPIAQPKAASATPAPELELLRATIQRLEEQNCAMKEQNAQLLEQITGMCQLLQEEKEEAKRREEKLEAQMEKLAAAHQRDRDVLNSLLAAKVGGGQPSASPRQPPTPLPRRSSAQPQQQQQQQQRNQHEQEQPRASTSRAVMPPRSEALTAVRGDVVPELTYSEVVRRRYRGKATGKPRSQQQPQQQQQQRQPQRQAAVTAEYQQQQQQRQPQRQAVAGSQQQQQEQQRKRKPRPDIIEVSPSEGETWDSIDDKVRKAIRHDPAYCGMKGHIKQGRRTHARLLRMELSKTANAPLMLDSVRKIIGDAGVSRLVTEMGELIVVDIDPLAAEEDVIAALDEKIGASAGVVSTSIWELPDGAKRARIRLPAKSARQLEGAKLFLCDCVSKVRAAPPTPPERQRCFRCLEMGHIASNCRSAADRQNLCIRCGLDGHKARTCQNEAKCALCGGAHHIGHSECARSALRCSRP
ncbi:mushroom body large-type Kenyon cell-specific protein 1-like [Anopheles gambiae]|uniref:mushroom body large-type Kenyon cell-specific protein 1-like n=1 Tax=Anopheles gambiae TaxID=7165 RepID=UPI002AC9A50C|nr:mushroom body large-type Kenyon cell-specific protein 1-like [Anopheles gambiae]